MASFISSCACRGIRPKKIDLRYKHVREELISKLMSQRSVLRFISAPNGFGKSILCGQYADLVFSFKDVFWIDCKSPCFIRDLDSNELVGQIIQICEFPKLVVFDDFKNLDEERSKQFSTVIDSLLEFNCEVIVNASPFNDAFIKYQNDAYILRSKDLLLAENEMKNPDDSNIDRIPVLAWDSKRNLESLLFCALTEDFTDAIMFSLFFIYLFGNSNLGALSKFLSKSDIKLLLDISDEYIYFGIDENKDSFSVPNIFTSKLISLFNSVMQTLINVAKCTDRSNFAEKLCSLLEENDKNKISMELASCIGSKELRLKTLTNLGEDSIRNQYLASACRLFDIVPIRKHNDGLLLSYNALRLALFGRISESVRYSYSVLDNKYSSIDNKLFAALIFLRFGNYNEVDQALKILRFLSSDFKIDNYLNNKKLSKNEKFKCSVIKRLTELSFAIHSSTKIPFSIWLSSVSDDLTMEDIISAEFIIGSINHIKKNLFLYDDFYKFINRLSRYFNLGTKSEFNFYCYRLIDTYLSKKNELESLSRKNLWNINDELMFKYEQYKNEFIKDTRELFISNNELIQAHEKNYFDVDGSSRLNNVSTVDGVPKLHISVLGGLSVYIGNKEIINTKFGRKNIKLICCILALENGKEIGKSELSKRIWIDCDDEARRVNVNSHWSVFRRLLTLPNGECPYLTKNQNSYKLNSRYFESDLQVLDKLCSELTLGPLDSQSWWETIVKNEQLISGAILPGETKNPYINNKRIEYRNKVVDALVSASNRLIDAGEIQQALWFAQKALSRDGSREDVYISLMKAQLEAGQRTPAVETYFACKKFLEEDYGLEPSRMMSDLYLKVVK